MKIISCYEIHFSGETATLKTLNCSWNEIRGPAAMTFAKGLKVILFSIQCKSIDQAKRSLAELVLHYSELK